MKIKSGILLLCLLALSTGTLSADTRVWTDKKGRKIEAKFVKLAGDKITIQLANGQIYTIPLSNLTDADQAIARELKPNEQALATLPSNASPYQAAARIDELVAAGIERANQMMSDNHQKKLEEATKEGKRIAAFTPLRFNAPATDEQFVRRIYLDIIGRIPTYDETNEFLRQASRDKSARSKLIDKLLGAPGTPLPDGAASHMYNYMANMLRISEQFSADFVRGLPYIQWMKDQVKANRPWNEIVDQMLTAKGKLWHNGATGYLLRDSGMQLDNLANTLTVFLGTDVSCAQCHDHPFAEWTQTQFYEMAGFFGATTTQMGRNDFAGGKNGDNPTQKLTEEAVAILEARDIDPARYRNTIQNVIAANRFAVNDLAQNRLRLPHDFRSENGTGNPGDAVTPKLIVWENTDPASNPAYQALTNVLDNANGGTPENLRSAFSTWLTHPDNPRFAMTIANRMWERAFGRALTPTVRNIDNVDEAYNPELLRHLANEMVRVKFDLREFQRIVFNSKTYQREATTAELPMGEPYYFQGPILRRMSPEQAWDSFMSLVVGPGLDSVKNDNADSYGRAIDMNINTIDAQTVLQKVNAVQDLGRRQRERMAAGGSLAAASKNANSKDSKDSDGMMMMSGPVSYEGMTLMRASELPQPAPGGHFLREFGQSDRSLIDGNSTEGSVPQVLLMMNGKAQEMLTSKDSLIFRNMNKVVSPPERVEAMFLSVLSRRPTLREKDIAKRALADGDDGYANMIWALINAREFYFIQ